MPNGGAIDGLVDDVFGAAEARLLCSSNRSSKFLHCKSIGDAGFVSLKDGLILVCL